MGDFNAAVQFVMRNEGGLEESKNDPGGITNFGISLRFLKSLAPETLKNIGFSPDPQTINRKNIEQLTPIEAQQIYKQEFWQHAPFEKINDQTICNYLFDAVVNMGISPGIKCIQRAIWSAAKQKGIIMDDGILGDKTIELINQFEASILCAAMRSERAGEYRIIAEKNLNSKEFLEGWLNRSYNEGKKV